MLVKDNIAAVVHIKLWFQIFHEGGITNVYKGSI